MNLVKFKGNARTRLTRRLRNRSKIADGHRVLETQIGGVSDGLQIECDGANDPKPSFALAVHYFDENDVYRDGVRIVMDLDDVEKLKDHLEDTLKIMGYQAERRQQTTQGAKP